MANSTIKTTVPVKLFFAKGRSLPSCHSQDSTGGYMHCAQKVERASWWMVRST